MLFTGETCHLVDSIVCSKLIFTHSVNICPVENVIHPFWTTGAVATGGANMGWFSPDWYATVLFERPHPVKIDVNAKY